MVSTGCPESYNYKNYGFDQRMGIFCIFSSIPRNERAAGVSINKPQENNHNKKSKLIDIRRFSLCEQFRDFFSAS